MDLIRSIGYRADPFISSETLWTSSFIAGCLMSGVDLASHECCKNRAP
jgi:hypothetical protein